MKSILFITRKYPPKIGGMEQFSYDFYNSISKKNSIELFNGSLFALFLKSIFLKNKFYEKYTHIHFSDGFTAFLVLFLKKKSSSKKVTFSATVHGLDIIYSNVGYQYFLKKVLNKIDNIVCVSKATKTEVLKRVSPKKIVVLPNGIMQNLEIKRIRQRPKVNNSRLHILLLGRQIKRKGTLYFLKYLLQEKKELLQHISITIAGCGRETSKIERFIQQNSLQGTITYMGNVSESTKNQLFSKSDLFIMPNIHLKGDMEGFGIVLLEASLNFVIPIGTRVDGIVDAISDNYNGHLCSNYNEISKQIEFYINNPLLLEKRKKEFSNYTLHHYNWETISEKYSKEVFL